MDSIWINPGKVKTSRSEGGDEKGRMRETQKEGGGRHKKREEGDAKGGRRETQREGR